MNKFTFIDLFAGIGGFRLAAESLGGRCVFSSEFNKDSQDTYERNFGEKPLGDITKIPSLCIPDHDLLFAGFPCQSFSTAGKKGGFDDARGKMIWEIMRIIRDKRPKAFLLENVKGLSSHDKGKTLGMIIRLLGDPANGGQGLFNLSFREGPGYVIFWGLLNALSFGLPQSRERILIVGFRPDVAPKEFVFPKGDSSSSRLKDILEENSEEIRWLTEIQMERIFLRIIRMKDRDFLGFEIPFSPGRIWDVKLSISFPEGHSGTLLSSTSNTYVSIGNRLRTFTPRECYRMQGFPESFILHPNGKTACRQIGNSIPIPMIRETIRKIMVTIQQ